MWSESERGSRIYKQKSKLKACGSTVTAFSKTFNWITRFVETRSFFFPGNAYCMVRKWTVNWYIYNLATVFFFFFLRNDLETRKACSFARFASDQDQNPKNPHPSHHPTAAVQSQSTSAPQHTHDQDQSAKPAIQSAANRPRHSPPGPHKAGGGDGRGRTSRVHPQGDCAERVWGYV